MEPFSKNRLEAFSDGVIAIIITIMVLELRPPSGIDLTTLKALLPTFLSYVLSFIYVAIYWNNHHHMLHTAKRINGRIMWANLHLLFWLSLFPFSTAWMGKTSAAPVPTAFYGLILLMAAFAYFLLQNAMIELAGRNSFLAKVIGQSFKEKISLVCYLAAIGFGFLNTGISIALYIGVALLWLIPDKRIEQFTEQNDL